MDTAKGLARALELWRRIAIQRAGTRSIAPDFASLLADQGLVVLEASAPDLVAMAATLTQAGYQVRPPEPAKPAEAI